MLNIRFTNGFLLLFSLFVMNFFFRVVVIIVVCDSFRRRRKKINHTHTILFYRLSLIRNFERVSRRNEHRSIQHTPSPTSMHTYKFSLVHKQFHNKNRRITAKSTKKFIQIRNKRKKKIVYICRNERTLWFKCMLKWKRARCGMNDVMPMAHFHRRLHELYHNIPKKSTLNWGLQCSMKPLYFFFLQIVFSLL